MKPKHVHGRKIGAFRTSGVNPRPTPQARPQTPQQPASRDDAVPPFHMVTMGSATLREPSLQGGADGVSIRLNGDTTYLPASVAVSFASSHGRDIAYVLSGDGEVTILVGSNAGVRELADVPQHMLDRIKRESFGL